MVEESSQVVYLTVHCVEKAGKIELLADVNMDVNNTGFITLKKKKKSQYVCRISRMHKMCSGEEQ